MLEIKKFAELCNCTTQTLRFYDKKGILKPTYIDSSSNYRYYLESQARDFVKVKQLQEAGFTLHEIQSVINEEDEKIFELFDQKIEKQKKQLFTTIALRETYQRNMINIEDRIKRTTLAERIEVSYSQNKLRLQKNNSSVKLQFRNDVQEIAELLQEMQHQILIGFGGLEDFRAHQEKTWNCTQVFSQWHKAKEITLQLPCIEAKERLIIHAFCMNDNLTIFDINNIIEATRPKGYTSDQIIFVVSLSRNHTNQYAILYTD